MISKINKKKFILFSKSLWTEVPRLRHQVTRLLLENDNNVVFFEKPLFFFQKKKGGSLEITENIEIKRTKQLLHHQFRCFDSLHYLNSLFEKFQISEELKDNNEIADSIIINFNYDYYFLRDLFPLNKIITIINDDFVAQAKFFKGRHVLHCLEKTCKMSDHVFVVSKPLQDQLKQWCNPILFFPWANNAYIKPRAELKRDSVLIWAHVDRRFDLDVVERLAFERSDLFIDIIGPVSFDLIDKVKKLGENFSNIHIGQPENINNINTDKYFCSLIPYKANVADIEAVTVSNKTFQLLAKGLPIVAHGMPNFYQHSAIFNCSDSNSILSAVDYCFQRFDGLQSSIKELVDVNQAKNRYSQLLEYI